MRVFNAIRCHFQNWTVKVSMCFPLNMPWFYFWEWWYVISKDSIFWKKNVCTRTERLYDRYRRTNLIPKWFLYWKGLIYLPIVCTCFSAVVPVQKRHHFLIIFSVCLLQILWCVESSMIMSNKTSFFNDKDSYDLCIQNVCRIHKVITFMFLRLRCLISLFVFWNISD